MERKNSKCSESKRRNLYGFVSILIPCLFVIIIAISGKKVRTFLGVFLTQYAVSIFSLLICFYAKATDPGVEKNIISNNGLAEVYPKFCKVCKVFVTSSSKHCQICKKCIQAYDHHCKWLNLCIGSKNYRFFFLYIFASLSSDLTILITLIKISTLDLFLSLQTIVDYLTVLITITIFAISLVLSSVKLFIFVFHLGICLKGTTTYQYNLARLGKIIPFKRIFREPTNSFEPPPYSRVCLTEHEEIIYRVRSNSV